MTYGLLNLSFWGYVLAILITTHISVMCVTIFLHRSQAHRSLNIHPIASHFFRFWLWLATGTVTKEWVAVHRKHHAKCETKDDPHSPQIHGIKKVLFEGFELYKGSYQDPQTLSEFGHGTPNDWLENNLYARHRNLGIMTLLTLDIILFGIPGITVWAIQMLWMPFFAGGVVNGIGHFFGYRNYESADASRNIVPWGILLAGEELHNNHHSFGTSAKLSVKWWEFDMGWLYICILRCLGLAKIRKASKLQTIPDKTLLDAGTLKAVIVHRLKVMDRYYREVVVPVLREEKLFFRARKLLKRDTSLVNDKKMQQLQKLLHEHKDLQVVYQSRLQLQKIWQRTSSGQKDLLGSLQEWCKQAEMSSIKALQEFAQNLKKYSLLLPATE